MIHISSLPTELWASRIEEWARLGGVATRERRGPEFYRKIRAMRRHYKKGYLTSKTKERLNQQADQIIQRLTKKVTRAVGASDARPLAGTSTAAYG